MSASSASLKHSSTICVGERASRLGCGGGIVGEPNLAALKMLIPGPIKHVCRLNLTTLKFHWHDTRTFYCFQTRQLPMCVPPTFILLVKLSTSATAKKSFILNNQIWLLRSIVTVNLIRPVNLHSKSPRSPLHWWKNATSSLDYIRSTVKCALN